MRDNPARGVTRVEAARDILGDVSAELGVVALVLAYGRVGTDAQPVTIRGKHGVVQVAGYEGVWADINSRVNGGAGSMFAPRRRVVHRHARDRADALAVERLARPDLDLGTLRGSHLDRPLVRPPGPVDGVLRVTASAARS